MPYLVYLSISLSLGITLPFLPRNRPWRSSTTSLPGFTTALTKAALNKFAVHNGILANTGLRVPPTIPVNTAQAGNADTQTATQPRTRDTQTATQNIDFYARPPELPAMPRLCQTETSPAKRQCELDKEHHQVHLVRSICPTSCKAPSTPNPYHLHLYLPLHSLLPSGCSTPGVVHANPKHTGYQAKEYDSDDDIFFEEHNSGFGRCRHNDAWRDSKKSLMWEQWHSQDAYG